MTPADLARQNAIQVRFESFVSPEPNSGCWLWFGRAHNKMGYGIFEFRKCRSLAHRTTWELYFGKITEGLSVLHKCDNPCCVNPEHLFLGTRADNNLDMCAKGRQRGAVGEANGNAKLTREQVALIRSMPKKPIKAICEEFGIKKSMVSYIRAGENWK